MGTGCHRRCWIYPISYSVHRISCHRLPSTPQNGSRTRFSFASSLHRVICGRQLQCFSLSLLFPTTFFGVQFVLGSHALPFSFRVVALSILTLSRTTLAHQSSHFRYYAPSAVIWALISGQYSISVQTFDPKLHLSTVLSSVVASAPNWLNHQIHHLAISCSYRRLPHARKFCFLIRLRLHQLLLASLDAAFAPTWFSYPDARYIHRVMCDPICARPHCAHSSETTLHRTVLAWPIAITLPLQLTYRISRCVRCSPCCLL